MRLTVDVEHDPLGDDGRDVVGGDAHEGAHVRAAQAHQVQVGPAELGRYVHNDCINAAFKENALNALK